MIKVIYFDLGGVIFSDFFSGAEKDLADKLHLSTQKVLDAYTKTDISTYCKDQLNDEGRWTSFVDALNLSHDLIPLCIDEFYKSYHLFPESFQFLKNLNEKNKYSLGVLSDQPIGIAKYLRHNFKNVFELFNSSQILISAEIRLSKKDADLKIYQLAIEKSKVHPEEILFVDNSQHNLDNANRLGIQTFFFDTKTQSLLNLLNNLEDLLHKTP